MKKSGIALPSKGTAKKIAPKAANLAKSLQLRTTAKDGAKVKK